jgi:hypothetical protein
MMKLALLADTSQFSKGLNSATKQTMTFGDRVKGVAKGIGLAFAGAAAAAAGFAIKLGVDGIKAASDFEETLSKVNVLFGKNAKELETWSKGAAKGFGQSQTQALDAAATFAIFGKSAGLQGKKLTGFAKNLTVLASDLASFNNTSPEEAIQAIGAALRGESEPIRKYGVLLNDATLKAEAMDMGLYKGKGTLDMSAKVLASYKTILKQTGDAQGDFERTSGGLANSQRTLSAVWDDIQVQIGQALAPTFTTFVDWLKTDGVSGIQTFIDVLQGGDGKTLQQAAFGAKKDMDGLNYAANSESKDAWINFGKAVKKAAEEFGKLFQKLELDDPEGNFNTLVNGLAFVADSLSFVAGSYKSVADNPLNLVQYSAPGTFIRGVKTGFEKLFGGGKASGGQVRTGMSYLVGENGPELFTPNGGGGNITPNHRMGGGVTVNVYGAADSRESARAIQRALSKIAANGGSQAGVLGFA